MERFVFCVKWRTRYSAEYVNLLHRMVKKFTTGEIRFVCTTDDPTGIEEGIEIRPCDFGLEYSWNKIGLLSQTLNPFEGVGLFLDLDVVIIDSIDPLFEFKPESPSVSNIEWFPINRPYPVFNMSIWRFHSGWGEDLYTDCIRRIQDGTLQDASSEKDGYTKRKFKDLDGEILAQRHWVSKYSRPEAYPKEWFSSYRYHCQQEIPDGTKIVVFHGVPKPHQIDDPGWQERWRCEDSFASL